MQLFGFKIGAFRDGGPGSPVTHFGIESKERGSVMLLRFGPGERTALHSHAFNCVSVVLKGALRERFWDGSVRYHDPGQVLVTPRHHLHSVCTKSRETWVLTFRGAWADTWIEVEEQWTANGVRFLRTVLGHGRVERGPKALLNERLLAARYPVPEDALRLLCAVRRRGADRRHPVRRFLDTLGAALASGRPPRPSYGAQEPVGKLVTPGTSEGRGKQKWSKT